MTTEPGQIRHQMKKHTILFVAADLTGPAGLALDREARAIRGELERSRYRDCFGIETRWAIEPLDLLRELRKLKPTVVHFSGSARIASTAAVAEAFGAAGASVELIVLSACYTEAQAEALLAHVDCVVGTSDSIRAAAARSFAIGFYGGLAEREPIARAYNQGRAAISLQGAGDGDPPQLVVRAGVDASELVLTARSRRLGPSRRRRSTSRRRGSDTSGSPAVPTSWRSSSGDSSDRT
jgi:hypothetical protein